MKINTLATIVMAAAMPILYSCNSHNSESVSENAKMDSEVQDGTAVSRIHQSDYDKKARIEEIKLFRKEYRTDAVLKVSNRQDTTIMEISFYGWRTDADFYAISKMMKVHDSIEFFAPADGGQIVKDTYKNINIIKQ